MNLWRLNLITDAEENIDPAQFCIDRNIIGIGWRVNHDQQIDETTYLRLGKERYDNNSWKVATNALMNRMECGDLCWTRNRNGDNFLARITGNWEYRANPSRYAADEYNEADVIQVRECEYFPVGGPDSIPGSINFRGFTLSQVHSKSAIYYSKHLYNELSEEPIYDLSGYVDLNFWELMSWYDCEDIVGIYLQEIYNYRIIPSTVKINTPKTEFVMKNEKSKAYVQVKQGNEWLNRDEFRYDQNDPVDWFLFSSEGNYDGREASHITFLEPRKLEKFARMNSKLMSFRIQKFIEFLNDN